MVIRINVTSSRKTNQSMGKKETSYKKHLMKMTFLAPNKNGLSFNFDSAIRMRHSPFSDGSSSTCAITSKVT